jgi:hypothetical protein
MPHQPIALDSTALIASSEESCIHKIIPNFGKEWVKQKPVPIAKTAR